MRSRFAEKNIDNLTKLFFSCTDLFEGFQGTHFFVAYYIIIMILLLFVEDFNLI